MATLAQKLPYTHAFSGGAQWGGHQRLPSDPDALDYLSRLAAVEGAVEVGIAMAVENFIKGCKADGIWDAIKASCILCGARTLAGALVPLVGTAPSNLNFLPEDYNRETGLKGDGSTKFLNTNRAVNSDGQDDCHVAGYCTEGTMLIAVSAFTTAGAISLSLASANGVTGRLRSTAGATSPPGGVPPTFYGGSRISSAGFTARGNGQSIFQNSASVANASLGNYQIQRYYDTRADGRVAYYSVGESLDLSLLDARVTALVQRIQLFLSTGLDASGYDDATVAYLLAAHNNGATLA